MGAQALLPVPPSHTTKLLDMGRMSGDERIQARCCLLGSMLTVGLSRCWPPESPKPPGSPKPHGSFKPPGSWGHLVCMEAAAAHLRLGL